MQRGLPPSEPSPWLVYPCGKHNKNHIFCSLSQPHNIRRRRIKELSGVTSILNQCSGWFLLRKEKTNYSLWNPNKSNSIQLPPPPLKPPIDDYALVSTPEDTNCKVFLFQTKLRTVLFIRYPFERKQWIKVPYAKLMEGIGADHRDHLCQPVSFNGKLYATLIDQNTLVTIDVDEADKLSIQLLCEIPQIPTIVFGHDCRMIASCGQLFYVSIGLGGKMFKQVVEVQVLKLDLSNLVWSRADNLMGQTFFIDQFQGFSIPAIGTEQEDNIYFTLPNNMALYLFNVRGGWLSATLPCIMLPKPWSNPMFFMPDTSAKIYHDTKKEISRKKERKDSELHVVEALPLSDLPLDLLNSIANCLISSDSVADYMSFRAVCRDFWLAAPKLNLRSMKIAPLSPWLQFTSDCRIQNFVDPKHGSRFLTSMTVPKSLEGTRLCYSKDGWLLMSDVLDYSMFFYNPFTNQVIDLPVLPGEFEVSGLLLSTWFSCIPTSPNCVVMGFGCRPIKVIFLIMRDKEWQILLGEANYEFMLNHSSPVYHEQAFYLLGVKGNLLTVSLSEEGPYWEILPKPKVPCEYFQQSYLLKWKGKLTSIFVGKMGEWIQTYVLNDTEMNWESIQNLGNDTFFVSQMSCLVKETTNTGMENRIYFPRFYGNGNDVIFYSLDTRRLHFDDKELENFDNTREQVFSGWIDPKY